MVPGGDKEGENSLLVDIAAPYRWGRWEGGNTLGEGWSLHGPCVATMVVCGV